MGGGSMSATNRGSERQPDDYYTTPSWAVAAILPHLGLGGGEKFANGCTVPTVLDPACGNGALLKAAQLHWGPRCYCAGIDIADRGWPGTIVRDALSDEPWPKAKLILANPPFSLAMEFLKRSLREVAEGGDVAFLLRIAWLAGQERAKFHKAHRSDVFVLPRRPSFTEHLRWHDVRCNMLFAPKKPGGKQAQCDREFGHDGQCMTIGTDSADYAWLVFGPAHVGRWQVLDVGRAAA
jgi:hypothetical protein